MHQAVFFYNRHHIKPATYKPSKSTCRPSATPVYELCLIARTEPCIVGYPCDRSSKTHALFLAERDRALVQVRDLSRQLSQLHQAYMSTLVA